MTLELKRPRAILFDWDNTLIDSWAAIHDAQNHVFAHFGMRLWSLDEIRAKVRASMRDTYPQLFGERWEEAGRIFYERFEAHHLDNLNPLPGASDLIQDLSAAGHYLAVVSNKKGDYLRKEAEQLGWHRYFGALVGAFDAHEDKPSIAPVDLALAGSGIAPGEDVWFAGDADVDLQCAIAAGCVPVLVRSEPPGPEEFDGHAPAAYVPDCIALSKLVATL